jgi:hypothetical protein
MTTEVMTLGALGAMDPDPYGYYPGYGNPTQTVEAGSYLPPSLNRAPMPPTSPSVPQNLLRPTNKGCTSCAKASSTAPITPSLAGLSGAAGRGTGALGAIGTQMPGGGVCLSPKEVDTMSWYVTGVSVGYRLLGTTVGAVQLYGRTKSTGGAVAGGVLGFFAPLVANGLMYFWPR